MTGRRVGSVLGIAIFESVFSGAVFPYLNSGETVFDASDQVLVKGFGLEFTVGMFVCLMTALQQ
jgi:hypothetical protein